MIYDSTMFFIRNDLFDLRYEKFYNIDYIKRRIEGNLDLFDCNNVIKLIPFNDSYPKAIFENWSYWKTFYKECET
jgi:hypothetical protein